MKNRMVKSKRTPVLVVTAFAAILPVWSQINLSTERIEKIYGSVFEVVAEKPDEGGLTYEKPLPLELLPYQERTDTYIPIGTAFAVGENLFLSAAHVFSLEYRTLREKLFLRDAAGTVYPVNTVIRYDNSRDYILFTTEGLANKHRLEPGSALNLNDRVYAVGNAYGEGVIIRDGLLTSMTSESENGEWKWLRYSAAVSPGNSGGPLLDSDGRVIGIVTARSDRENLNYGLPIAEAGEFTTGKAKLHLNTVYGLPQIQATYRKIYDYSVELPMQYAALRSRLRMLEETAVETSYRKLLEENRQEMFPDDDGSAEALVSVPVTLFPCVYAEKDDSTWSLFQPKETSVAELPGGTRLRYGTIWNSTFWQLDLTGQTQVKSLFSDPKLLMDMLLQGNRATRAVGSAGIRITSYGKPGKTGWLKDRWGRRWLSCSWDVPFADQTVVLMALPVPSGAVGLMRSVHTSRAFAFMLDFEEILNAVYVCYYSSFLRWVDFLRSADLIPDSFREFEFSYAADGSVALSTEAFELNCDGGAIGFSDESALFLTPSFQKKSGVPVWEISRAFLYRTKESGDCLAMEKGFRPPETGGEDKKNAWQAISLKKYPYTGTPIVSGGKTYVYETVEPKGIKPSEPSLNFLWTVRLSREGEQRDTDMKRLFRTFRNGFTLKPAELEAMVFGGPLMVRPKPRPLVTLDGMTIFDAVASGDAAALKKFITTGTDLNARNDERRTPLAAALRLGKTVYAEMLLDAGADPDTTDAFGHTPLILALRNSTEEFCGKLVAKGADIRRADPDGFTPLMLACGRGFASLAAALAIKGAPLEPTASNGKTAIFYAASAGLSEFVRTLALAGVPLDAADSDGVTLLMAALENCDAETVETLIDRGAPTGGRTKDGWSALMYALRYGKSAFAPELAGDGDLLNAANVDGWTALHMASRYCGPDAVRFLVEAGADASAATGNGRDPLMLSLINEDKTAADYLLSLKPDFNGADPDGWTPLMYALRYGTDGQSRSIASGTRDLDSRTSEGWTAVHFALRYGRSVTASYLIENGADVTVVNGAGATPLMTAVAYAPALIGDLVRKGAPVDAVDEAGETALHHAVRLSSAGAVQALLRSKADPEVRNRDGKTARELAEGNPKLETLF